MHCIKLVQLPIGIRSQLGKVRTHGMNPNMQLITMGKKHSGMSSPSDMEAEVLQQPGFLIGIGIGNGMAPVGQKLYCCLAPPTLLLVEVGEAGVGEDHMRDLKVAEEEAEVGEAGVENIMLAIWTLA